MTSDTMIDITPDSSQPADGEPRVPEPALPDPRPEPSPAPSPPTPPAEPADASPPADDVLARLQEAQKALESANRKLWLQEARRMIQGALLDAQAIDLDAASLMIEATLTEGMSDLRTFGERDARRAVQELRRRKPALFRPPPRLRIGTMGVRVEPAGTAGAEPMLRAAEHALRSGLRGDLLRYLRMRRTP
ncbi:MAG: hypothetical protein AB7G11_00950 [Phycisphaerales bacterium]